MNGPLSLRTRLVCFFKCEGVYILSLVGSGLCKPCRRCGRTRYIG